MEDPITKAIQYLDEADRIRVQALPMDEGPQRDRLLLIAEQLYVLHDCYLELEEPGFLAAIHSNSFVQLDQA